MSHQVHTYAELEQQIHEDLRTQHPEWIQPSGKCPECDEHEARLKELLEALARCEANPESSRNQVLTDNRRIGL